ncbi:MAG: BrnT family toxin [Deltaproteobacteria bacterium]|nr:BrnT family toxin [Deltaproteobacteria bacterium]
MQVEYWLHGIWFRGDSRKAATNLRKHRVSFESACESFFDPFVYWIESQMVWGEEREKIIGMTPDWQFLVVIYAESAEAIRLISARQATRQERQSYEDQ